MYLIIYVFNHTRILLQVYFTIPYVFYGEIVCMLWRYGARTEPDPLSSEGGTTSVFQGLSSEACNLKPKARIWP